MASTPNQRKIIFMSAGALIGGLIGGICGIFVLNPGVLIPIGLVIGLSISMALARRNA